MDYRLILNLVANIIIDSLKIKNKKVINNLKRICDKYSMIELLIYFIGNPSQIVAKHVLKKKSVSYTYKHMYGVNILLLLV